MKWKLSEDEIWNLLSLDFSTVVPFLFRNERLMFASSKYVCTLFPAAVSLQSLFDEAQFISLQLFVKTMKIVIRNYAELIPGLKRFMFAGIFLIVWRPRPLHARVEGQTNEIIQKVKLSLGFYCKILFSLLAFDTKRCSDRKLRKSLRMGPQ